MKIKHSKSYYVYQVFNTIILTLVTLSCISRFFMCSPCP